MKKNIFSIIALSILLITPFFVACDSWLKVEAEEFASTADTGTPGVADPPPDPPYDPITDQKYVDLRAWKATPNLPQVFVWFDDWAAEVGQAYSMSNLPDSVTIISNWGQPKWNLQESERKDMEYVQQVKGTKVVVTLFSGLVGDDVAPDPIYETVGSSSVESVVRPGIRKYAEALHDAIVAEGYDGYDWDYEPTVCGCTGKYLWQNTVQRRVFLEELSYWFGKAASDPTRDRDGRKPAKPGLLLLIDGEVGSPNNMGADWLTYNIDYFVHQAYNTSATVSTANNSLQSRATGTLNGMTNWVTQNKITNVEIIRRCIMTENFESNAVSGAGVLNMANYVFAPTSGTYRGVDQQIGGFGIYRVGFDYKSSHTFADSKEYGFLRHGISNLYNKYRSRLP